MTTVAVVVSSIGVGVGLIGCVAALRGSSAVGASNAGATWTWLSISRKRHRTGRLAAIESPKPLARIMLPLISAVFVGTITRWPVAALLAGIATFTVPSALRSTSSRDSIRRAEAVAIWTELLRDSLTASAGLAQAVVATAGVAPEVIGLPTGNLADRVMSGVPMDEALRAFAAEIDDPSADEVVRALRLAATSRAQRLVDLLGALADSTRDVVAMRLRVEASRASSRSGVRMVICFSLGFVALLTVVARSYLAPFGSFNGQVVLALVGLLYAAGLALMVRLVRSGSSRPPSGEMFR